MKELTEQEKKLRDILREIQFRNRETHEERYINWSEEAYTIYLTEAEYAEKLKYFRDNYQYIDTLDSNNSRTRRRDFPEKSFSTYTACNKRIKEHRIYANTETGYVIYAMRKDGKDPLQKDVVKMVGDKFKERTGKTLKEVFGSTEYELRSAIPTPLYYVNPNALSTPQSLKNRFCTAIDGCSQYLYGLSGKLPTANDMRLVEGRVKPTAEYPFAIYTNGYVAVYNEFDTHDWFDLDPLLVVQAVYRGKNEVEERLAHIDDCKTYLFKEAEEDLGTDLKYWFDIKESSPKGSKERDFAKLVTNAFTGCLHRKDKRFYKSAPFNHLACVAIARAQNNTLKIISKLPFSDVDHICVDGIFFRGRHFVGQVQKEKYSLGDLKDEYKGVVEVFFRGINEYLVRKDGENIDVKHQGTTILQDGRDIDDALKDLKPIDIFSFTKRDVDEKEYENELYRRRKI